MCRFPSAEPVRIWFIWGCQVMLVSGDGVMVVVAVVVCSGDAVGGDREWVCSEVRVAEERMWRVLLVSPVRRVVLLVGEKIMGVGVGVGKFARVVMGVLSLRVSHTGLLGVFVSFVSCGGRRKGGGTNVLCIGLRP